eukprot:scaffold14060_cov71-Skeletonema_dohrnii-CCMP3373.AAC.1
MSVGNEQASVGDQTPLAQSTVTVAGAEAGGHFDMHPSAPPSPESMNRMNLDEDKTGEELSADEVAIIFSFLPHQEIMQARRVCKTWRDAAKKTIVPPSLFVVDSLKSYNAMSVMATALPHLQQLSISNINGRHKYSDGEDPPDEEIAADTANYTTHDINIISSLRKLRSLAIRGAHLSGRYPVLSTFSLLTKFSISYCNYLKFDLDVLVGFPLLKELWLLGNQHLTGNLRSLRVLKDTLEELLICGSRNIEGNIMDLTDFPRLKKLDLTLTFATGDIRNIRRNDFPALENLSLPATVHGGMFYNFQSISDVPDFMHTIHSLLQRTPTLFREIWLSRAFAWSLSGQSPDRYAGIIGNQSPPFDLQLIRAGSRRGWSWCSFGSENERHSCEINWLDPEPSSDSSDYVAYIEDLQRVERNIDFYRGYYNPPTEDEYNRLCEE